MVKEILLDTGVITLYFLKDTPEKIQQLFDQIKNRQVIASTISPILTETYKHLTMKKGKSFAQNSINSLLERFDLKLIEMGKSIIFKSGDLKCEYKDLSYNNCFLIATAIIIRKEIHGTEKSWPDLPHLKIVKYAF